MKERILAFVVPVLVLSVFFWLLVLAFGATPPDLGGATPIPV